jgi:RNA polymerase sigma-70 factor (ECF subfamily)
MDEHYDALCALAGTEQLATYAKRWVSTYEDAQDIAQDSLFKAFKALDRFDPKKAKLMTWVYSITRNTAIDFLRKKKAKVDKSIDEIVSLELSYSEDVEGALDGEAEKAKIRRCLKRLNIKDRRLIGLIDFQDKTSAEAGGLLKKAAGTIRNYLMHAKLALKEQLEQEEANKLLASEGLKYCECGCGTKIPLFDKKKRPRSYVKGHHRRNYKKADVTEIIKCGCGCGEELLAVDKHGKSGRTHINGHNRRGKTKYDHTEMVECACGCGQQRLRYHQLSGREYRYIKGHNTRMYSTEIERSRAHRAKNKQLSVAKGDFPAIIDKYCKYCEQIAPTQHSGGFLADGSPQYRNKCIGCKRKHNREYMRKKRSA